VSGRRECPYNPGPAQAKALLIGPICMRLKKVEDTSCAIRDVFDSLATCGSISGGPRLLSRIGFEGVGGG
jgi:hypothetical protein